MHATLFAARPLPQPHKERGRFVRGAPPYSADRLARLFAFYDVKPSCFQAVAPDRRTLLGCGDTLGRCQNAAGAGRAFRMAHPSWRALRRRRSGSRLVYRQAKLAKPQRSRSVLLGDLCVFAFFSDRFARRPYHLRRMTSDPACHRHWHIAGHVILSRPIADRLYPISCRRGKCGKSRSGG
jgi:hypothetical protein